MYGITSWFSQRIFTPVASIGARVISNFIIIIHSGFLYRPWDAWSMKVFGMKNMSKILAPCFFQILPCITSGCKLYQIAREGDILNLPLLLLSNSDTSPSTGVSLEGPNTISLLSRCCRRDHIFCTEWHAEIFSIRPSFVPKGAMKECEAGGGSNLLHSDCWAFILGLFRKLPHSDKCDPFWQMWRLWHAGKSFVFCSSK